MFLFLHQTEDIMDTELTPTQMAIEFLRRDPTVMTPAQYLKKLKLLELEFADLMALSSLELKEEIDHHLELAPHHWRTGLSPAIRSGKTLSPARREIAAPDRTGARF